VLRKSAVADDAIEEVCSGNLENVWNDRPSSKLMLTEPFGAEQEVSVRLIELIPPLHQRVYRIGLEHVRFVVGDDVDAFSVRHRAVLTGQQFQSQVWEPGGRRSRSVRGVVTSRGESGDRIDLRGKTALVTGASGGVGARIAAGSPRPVPG
jgi:hypothetical protein